MKQYPEWIDEYADVFYSSFQMHDVRVHMPFNGWDFYPLFADLWADKLYEAICAFRDKGLRIEDVLPHLPNHGSMKFKFSEILFCFKYGRVSAQKVRAVSDFFVKVIRAQTWGEPLWANNRIGACADVEKVLADIKPVPADRARASEMGKIITGCGTLGHGLYNDFCVDLSYDMYGPYDVSAHYGPGAIMLIRDFADLNPTELWRDHAPFPYKHIVAVGIYTNVTLTPTFVTCQMISSGNLIDNLTHFQVLVDGKPTNTLEDLKVVREKLLAVSSKLYAEYQRFDFEKNKEFWIWQLCYQMKQLFDLAGVDWRPSKEMLDRVKGKDLVPTIQTYNMPREEFFEKFGVTYLKQAYNQQ